jgi:predicted ATPase with chaperone activity
MIKFDKPTNLNGAELLDELAAVGVIVNAKTSPVIDGNGDFWLDIPLSEKTKAEPIVAAHNGTLIAPDLLAQRQAILDRLGLTAEEAKLLLS